MLQGRRGHATAKAAAAAFAVAVFAYICGYLRFRRGRDAQPPKPIRSPIRVERFMVVRDELAGSPSRWWNV